MPKHHSAYARGTIRDRRQDDAEADTKGWVRFSLRTLPLTAIITMVSIGPEYALSSYSICSAAFLGLTTAFFKEAREQGMLLRLARKAAEPQPSRFSSDKVKHAYQTFAGRAYNLLSNVQSPNEHVRGLLTFLDIRLGRVRGV